MTMIRIFRYPQASKKTVAVWILEDILGILIAGCLVLATCSRLARSQDAAWIVDRLRDNEARTDALRFDMEHRVTSLETEMKAISAKLDSQSQFLWWILGATGLLGTKSSIDMVKGMSRRREGRE